MQCFVTGLVLVAPLTQRETMPAGTPALLTVPRAGDETQVSNAGVTHGESARRPSSGAFLIVLLRAPILALRVETLARVTVEDSLQANPFTSLVFG